MLLSQDGFPPSLGKSPGSPGMRDVDAPEPGWVSSLLPSLGKSPGSPGMRDAVLRG